MAESAEAAPGARGSRPGVQVIARAATILRAIGPDPNGMALADVVSATGLPKSTAYRILLALEDEDLLETFERRYRFGPALGGGRLPVIEDIRARARPYLEQLAARVQESVALGVITGASVQVIDEVRWHGELSAGVTIGALYPLHSAALGKALLASNPDIAEHVLEDTLAPATVNTLTDPTRLRRSLAKIRREGVAYDEEENRPGVCGLAVPVTASDGTPLSLGIPLPTVRFREQRDELTRSLLQARIHLEEIL